MHTDSFKTNFVTYLGTYPKPNISRVFGRGRHGITAPHMSLVTACTRQKLLVIYQNLYLPSFWVLNWMDTSQFPLQFRVALWLYSCQENIREYHKAFLFVPSCFHIFGQININIQRNHRSHALVVGKPPSTLVPK